jgi:hypothetical protein
MTLPVRTSLVAKPVCPVQSRVMSANSAYQEVLGKAGAFPRDDLDLRTVREVREQSGQILSDAAFVKGPRPLPPIAPGKPYADADGDGMSDEWEKANGLDVQRRDMWEDRDRDGWANLSEFLDFAHQQVLAGRTLQ